MTNRTYLWPDRPNDEYAYAKHVWKWFAAAYVIYCIWLYCVTR